MAAKLLKGMKGLFDLLKTKNQGDLVSNAEVMAAANWSESTLKTYVKKNKLSRFLAPSSAGGFRALRNGATITEGEVQGALTQVTPELLPLAAKDILQGQTNTYVLLKELGRGAVGHVWQVRSAAGDAYAAKIMNPRADLLEPTAFENVKARFRREARNGSKLDHPRVVRVLDFGEHEGVPFVVMELANGSLGSSLEAVGRLEPATASDAILRVVDGLRYIHGMGCVHRDVKPDNMLLAARGVIVGDLGIVKWSDMNPAFTSAATLTLNSVRLGSWHYMAPEQMQTPHEATPASDVYALGVSYYQLLTGSVESPAAFAAQTLPAPTKVAAVNDLILRMTRFAPADRPALDEVERVIRAAGLA